MSSETTMKLPVIDFSNLKKEKATWESVKTQVSKALEEYGCFEAIFFDKIPLHLRKPLADVLQQLFDLPLEIKKLNRTPDIIGPAGGFGEEDASVPLYESLGISDIFIPGKIEAFANLMWAHGNPTFCENIRSMSEELLELAEIVRRMVLENLGLDKYEGEHIDTTRYIFRCQKYDGPNTDEAKLGLVSHVDTNTISILYQDDVTGLEVLTKDGHNWIEASPNSFIVMAGESFQAWTNGRVHGPVHRVMMTGEEARYSIGLFAKHKSGYIVKAPEEMVDEEHPLLFKPFDYGQFLDYYYSSANDTANGALKVYCGL